MDTTNNTAADGLGVLGRHVVKFCRRTIIARDIDRTKTQPTSPLK